MRVRDDVGLDDFTVDLTDQWHGGRRVHARREGRTVFTCSVMPQEHAWFVTDCLPQRRDPEPAALLRAVCAHLAAEHGMTEIVALHPEFWDDDMSEGGAVLLQRIVPMWLPLDDDLLVLHSRDLPGTHHFTPLDPRFHEPALLAGLSTEADRAGDRRVWQDALSGVLGPIIREASLVVVRGSVPRAAIAVSEFQGAPLVAHLVIAESERGNGLGRALLVESLRGLARSGYTDCHLNVLHENWVAHRLYRSVGFIQNRPTLRASHLSLEPARDER
ncbi:GNAT family N-acetyltransferase [Lentzea sp. HUAS TT2]|uniref:GNAT family N-acetyltransferase n=1 Tax=Lentzea sp. HUAS TT2 TaxID=3447454 RepID=UPI003F70DE3C